MIQRLQIPQFPNSILDPFYLTSPPSGLYNCIAWAYGDDTKWYWPDSNNNYYWPDDIPRAEIIDSFILLFAKIGYEICDNAETETGFEKVAIYTDITGRPTHAARQLQSGFWTSKLGP